MKGLSQFEKASKGRILTSNAAVRGLTRVGNTAVSSQRVAEIPEDRLDSWKEIASYLGREVRTVQRWEKRECLPVHRHFHHRLGSVYAFKREIEKWRKDRSSGPGAVSPPGAEACTDRGGALLPLRLKNQPALPQEASHSSLQGKNENFVHAIIFVAPGLQALPKELQALHLGKLLTISVSGRSRRAAGFAAVSAANAR